MVLFIAIAVALSHPLQAGQTRTYAGRPVADVLQELQTPDLKLIFSTDLVPSTLRVQSEPTSKDPKEIARQILAPHGLTLQAGPRGTMLVVASPRTNLPAARQPKPPPSPSATKPPGEPGPPHEPLRIKEEVNVVDRLGEGSRIASVYTVRPAQILETAGNFENVLLTLQLMPGVAGVNDKDGKFAVRGGGPEHNLIVVDGVQIHNPQRFGEFTSSFVNPTTVENVTLDASGLEARHGGRLSSVTTFETRDGSRTRRLGVSGSVGLTNGDVLFEGRLPATESGTWWATARGTYYRAVSDRFTDGMEPGFGDLQAKVSLQPGERTRLSIFGLVGRETMREFARQGDHTHITGVFEGNNGLGVTNFTWNPGPRLVTTTTLSAYTHDERYGNEIPGFRIDPFERELGMHDFAGRQRALYAFSPGHVLDAGMEVHRIRSDWRMRGVMPPQTWRGLGPSTSGELVEYPDGSIGTSLTRTQVGAWLQDRLPIGSHAALEPGVRLDWNSFTREASWQPRLRVTTRIAGATVWAGVAAQVQTPSHESLQGFDYVHITQADGSQLRNERSRQVVAGVERALGAGFDLRVEAYDRRFDRLLVQRLETDEERAQRLAKFEIPPGLPPDDVIFEHRPTIHPESTGRGSARGIELLVQRRTGRVTGWLAYTLSKATRELHGLSVPFDYDRPHALAAVGTYQLSRRFRLSATVQLASGFPVTPLLDEASFDTVAPADDANLQDDRPAQNDGSMRSELQPTLRRLSERNSERLSAYSRADVRATFATLGHWEFYGEVINVFDRKNYGETIRFLSSSRSPGTGSRSIYAEFGRMPTFGVRVKF